MNDIERRLQAQFSPETARKFTSTAKDPAPSALVSELALPDESRGRLPLTQDKFIGAENPQRVEWERETRKFLARVNTRHTSHRVTAEMVYEWVTGISLAELRKLEGVEGANGRGGGRNGSANVHLRHIRWVLGEYFGTPYKTKIAGREVGKAYKVPKYWKVQNKKPECMTLWPEWDNGTLRP